MVWTPLLKFLLAVIFYFCTLEWVWSIQEHTLAVELTMKQNGFAHAVPASKESKYGFVSGDQFSNWLGSQKHFPTYLTKEATR